MLVNLGKLVSGFMQGLFMFLKAFLLNEHIDFLLSVIFGNKIMYVCGLRYNNSECRLEIIV